MLPAGPTVEDEMANTAFWLGLMNGLPDRCRNPTGISFPLTSPKENFLKAAQMGIEVQFEWMDGQLVSAQELILG